jgi:hypothetical protein
LPWLPWNIKNTNPQFSKAHLTTLNLNNFKTLEAVGLKITAPFNVITSVSNFMKIYTHRDRQAGDLISLLLFFESRLIKGALEPKITLMSIVDYDDYNSLC